MPNYFYSYTYIFCKINIFLVPNRVMNGMNCLIIYEIVQNYLLCAAPLRIQIRLIFGWKLCVVGILCWKYVNSKLYYHILLCLVIAMSLYASNLQPYHKLKKEIQKIILKKMSHISILVSILLFLWSLILSPGRNLFTYQIYPRYNLHIAYDYELYLWTQFTGIWL